MAALEESIDRVMAGPERKSVLLSERERKLIAYHEGGHALVGHALPNADPVHKITIIPRGRALGYTASAPQEDKFLVTRVGDDGPAGHAARRPDRGGTGLPRAHHRRGQRHREGKLDRPRHGHRVRHERAARRPQVRHRRRRAVPRPGRCRTPGTTPRRSPPRSTRRCAGSSSPRTTRRGRSWSTYREVLDDLVLQLMDKETLSRKEVLEDLRADPEAPDPRLLHRLRQAAALGPPAGPDAQGAGPDRRGGRQGPSVGRQRPGSARRSLGGAAARSATSRRARLRGRTAPCPARAG